jgi:hypothetical protein
LKVRELPSVDHNEIDKGLHEADLGRIASELGLLAAELGPEEAAVEFKLRGEYIGAERRLFLTRLERGQILAGYKALYGPMRKWSEFLRVIGIARRTAYDLLDAAEETEAPVCAETAQLRRKRRGPAAVYDFDSAVDKAEASLTRIFSGLTETQRQRALDALVDRLGSRTGIRLAA